MKALWYNAVSVGTASYYSMLTLRVSLAEAIRDKGCSHSTN